MPRELIFIFTHKHTFLIINYWVIILIRHDYNKNEEDLKI